VPYLVYLGDEVVASSHEDRYLAGPGDTVRLDFRVPITDENEHDKRQGRDPVLEVAVNGNQSINCQIPLGQAGVREH
jgi:hypothetical protein